MTTNSCTRSSGGIWFVVFLVLVLASNTALAQSFEIGASLRYPAGDQDSPQPTGLFVDNHTGDIYVADATTARIAIYDAQRRFNFEFSTRERVTNPQQVAVDAMGRIYVLGDTRQHVLSVFDYNGEFVRYLDLTVDGVRLEPDGLALDADDNLYVLTAEPAWTHVFSTAGEFIRSYRILQELDQETQNTPMFGSVTVIGQEMIVPLPFIGQVARVDLSGKLICIFGIPGGGPTELSFPAACAKTSNGEYAVLDKHRHLIQFIDVDGKYLREVGCAGLAEGCFFHPTGLVTCADGTLLVGQAYANRIQSVVFRSEAVASGS